MKKNWLLAITLGMSLAGSWVGAQTTGAPNAEPEKVTINTSVAAYEIREYKVDLSAKGSVVPEGGTAASDLDASLSATILHKYGKREADKLLLLEISLLGGEATIGGQKLGVTASLYPKISVLLDCNWNINSVYGTEVSSLTQNTPGFGYGNLIVLFYPLGPVQPRAIGETWKASQVLNGTYEFTNTLKRVDTVDGVKAATIAQEIVRKPDKEAADSSDYLKATAESAFAINDGKLLKSHVDCDVKSSTIKQAKVKLDISYVAPTPQDSAK